MELFVDMYGSWFYQAKWFTVIMFVCKCALPVFTLSKSKRLNCDTLTKDEYCFSLSYSFNVGGSITYWYIFDMAARIEKPCQLSFEYKTEMKKQSELYSALCTDAFGWKWVKPVDNSKNIYTHILYRTLIEINLSNGLIYHFCYMHIAWCFDLSERLFVLLYNHLVVHVLEFNAWLPVIFVYASQSLSSSIFLSSSLSILW